MREIEQIIERHSESSSYNNMINLEIQNLIKQAYNLGLQDATDNAEVSVEFGNPYDSNSKYYEVDKESILKLKL
jgi:hypothetical protein